MEIAIMFTLPCYACLLQRRQSPKSSEILGKLKICSKTVTSVRDLTQYSTLLFHWLKSKAQIVPGEGGLPLLLPTKIGNVLSLLIS